MSKKPIFDVLSRGPQDGLLPPGYWTADIELEQALEFFGRIPDEAPAKNIDVLAAHFFEGGIDPSYPLSTDPEIDGAYGAEWNDYESAAAKLKTTGGKGRDTTETAPGNGKAVGKNKNTEETDAGDTTSDTTTTSNDDASETSTGTTNTSTGDNATSGSDGTTTDTDGNATETNSGGTTETNTGSADPNTHVSGLDTPDGFNVELVFEGEWDAALKQVVIDTTETLSDLIIADIPSYNGVDDIKIQAYLSETSGSLAQGGHFMTRDDSSLPSNGFIMLNTEGALAAMDGGYLDELVMHEMLHAMGFGTTWDNMDLVSDYDGDLRFTGANATEAYNTIYGDIAADDPLASQGVPVETDGGAGTAGKHWDEATFGDELMTGSLTGEDMLSALTLAALEDMGYETVYGEEPEEEILIF